MITNELLAQGTVIREPVGAGPGYWAGAPGAFFDETTRDWYLCYRIRRPRGVAPDRGGEVRIARSRDLERWDDVVSIHKDRYRSASIERSCLHRAPDGRWHYFTSFVHPDDGRWCTAVLRADRVEALDRAKHEIIFTGPPLGLEGVKDPWLFQHAGVHHLFLSIATPTPQTGQDSHASLDIFNTGECKSVTGLAVSRDLVHWEWQGTVLDAPATGWDRYCRRMNAIVPLAGTGAGPRYLGFYDGSASHLENYEEKCALAVSDDLRGWKSVSTGGPRLTSPHASRSVRYVEAKIAGGKCQLFYEFVRSDGAHDLRRIACEVKDVAALL